jgi:type IV secretory pathway TrbD component
LKYNIIFAGKITLTDAGRLFSVGDIWKKGKLDVGTAMAVAWLIALWSMVAPAQKNALFVQIAMAQVNRRSSMGKELDFETRIKQAQIAEAEARAEKAREEVRHERTKRIKTQYEAEYVNHEKWHGGAKAVAIMGGFLVTAVGLWLKSKE